MLGLQGWITPKPSKDSCEACPLAMYRPAFEPACLLCPAGYESGPSSKTACTPCRPGYMSDASTDECVACDRNTYQPKSGQTACLECPAGYEGTDSGTANTACTPCANGFYKLCLRGGPCGHLCL